MEGTERVDGVQSGICCAIGHAGDSSSLVLELWFVVSGEMGCCLLMGLNSGCESSHGVEGDSEND